MRRWEQRDKVTSLESTTGKCESLSKTSLPDLKLPKPMLFLPHLASSRKNTSFEVRKLGFASKLCNLVAF